MTNTLLNGVMLWAVPRFRRQEASSRQIDQPVLAGKPILALREDRTDACLFETGMDAFPNAGLTSR